MKAFSVGFIYLFIFILFCFALFLLRHIFFNIEMFWYYKAFVEKVGNEMFDWRLSLSSQIFLFYSHCCYRKLLLASFLLCCLWWNFRNLFAFSHSIEKASRSLMLPIREQIEEWVHLCFFIFSCSWILLVSTLFALQVCICFIVKYVQ